jgi:hypothetical protein
MIKKKSANVQFTMVFTSYTVGGRYGGKGDLGEVNRIENRTERKFKILFVLGV